ncbi:MAG: glycosyltransferase [Halioglobus sp.]|nr:glycosyltransferase [Halioglobus sp.]
MGAAPISDHRNISLAVCICTFQRPEGLARVLDGLDRQQRLEAVDLCIIVADNSPGGDAHEWLQERAGHWPLHYRHEPRPGISHARNAALAAVPEGTDFIAMLDDDEEPVPEWLAQLLAAQAQSGADIVVGPTLPRLPQTAPGWIGDIEYFAKPQNYRALAALDPDPPAATCNVLLRAGLFAHGLAFDPALALSGGEDKLLFQDLKRRGATFAYAPEARAIEYIPTERATLHYMWREAYRRGTVKYLVKRRLKSRSAGKSAALAARLLGRSALRTLRDAVLLVVALPGGPARWAPRLLAIADSLGTCAGVLGIPNRHYRPEARA